MDILKIATAGSVDDGKSSLIGRLLYDTKSVTKDKLEAVESISKRKGLSFVDLSLLTDGLIAEREQGITIDVAHIYFNTENRKYIIADTPGHVEYTRNMITGASNAETAIVLIDARNGVWEQTRRHLSIFSLLRLTTVFICINKMDMVSYEENIFTTIKKNAEDLVEKINFKGKVVFIPISAKYGDNVVSVSANMEWYKGETLLNYLEKLPVHEMDKKQPARFPVQLVIRPHNDAYHDFRGYAGKIASGTFAEGDEITVLPSLKKSIIKSIHRGEKKIAAAVAGESVLLELEKDIDISRGNMIVAANNNYKLLTNFNATIAWLDDAPLENNKTYLLQHGVNSTTAKIVSLNTVINMKTMEENKTVTNFKLNDIGKISLKTAQPVFADDYNDVPVNGVFILIDKFSNKTVGVGFVEV